ncbi:hypothetical protein BHU72_08195 [Desulfuribacillus stibiiarsenatis]|uniref:G domain-containing protein n=1 Tax=Desulfuribacillus stibiiarsenatis TaxID=1390249 RepID=A0A1E5L3Y9_9FIRM|nr:GTPase [Desulfuribacillus stibiiarsenatis]OEH84804.1 hypothetical protein BHU72_08195 [Desulfuribacillus stibiiarsenatis]
MIEFLITGRKEVGKTLFMLQFSEYIAKENGYDCLYQSSKGVQLRKISDIGNAIKIYNEDIGKNNLPKSITMSTHSKDKLLKFTDTYGLIDGIQYNSIDRQNIKTSLQAIMECDNLIHIIDHNNLDKKSLDPIDLELYNIGKQKRFYMMLINKTDLEKTMLKFQDYKKKTKLPIHPISSIYKEGFFHVFQQIKTVMQQPLLGR